MGRKTATGDPTPYTEQDESDLISAADEGWEEYEADRQVPSRMTVTAIVEWSGSRNLSNNGMRTVRLDDLDLGRAAQALDRARAASERAASARPAESMRATGWHAQIRALTASARGSDAADRAGLNPSARTLSAWLSESRAPSRANREAIARAYEELRTANVERARESARQARHAATQAISDAVRDRYGADVRFFDVRSVEFDD